MFNFLYFSAGAENIRFLLTQKRKNKFYTFIRLKACKHSAQGIALGPTVRTKTDRQAVSLRELFQQPFRLLRLSSDGLTLTSDKQVA